MRSLWSWRQPDFWLEWCYLCPTLWRHHRTNRLRSAPIDLRAWFAVWFAAIVRNLHQMLRPNFPSTFAWPSPNNKSVTNQLTNEKNREKRLIKQALTGVCCGSSVPFWLILPNKLIFDSFPSATRAALNDRRSAWKCMHCSMHWWRFSFPCSLWPIIFWLQKKNNARKFATESMSHAICRTFISFRGEEKLFRRLNEAMNVEAVQLLRMSYL